MSTCLQGRFASRVAAHAQGARAVSVMLLAAATALSACSKGDGSVTISGDVAGLDTIGLRGDALIANAGKLPSATDSARAVAEGKVSRLPSMKGNNSVSATTSVALPSLPGVNPMSQRAQARGDSMARAEAMKLVGGSDVSGRSHGDTIRGVVTLIGTAPAAQVVLKPAQGNTINMSGMATSGMSKLAGAEIVVRGVRITPRDVVVSDFIVRAADGVPAYDGKLAAADGGWALQLTDGSGRKRLSVVPAALQGLEGTRVWVALKPGDNTPHAYGVIGRR